MRKHTWLVVISLVSVLIVSSMASAVVEIDYWGMWGGVDSGPMERDVVAAFNEHYAGIYRVNPMEIPGGPEERLLVAIPGGAAPAVAKLDRFQVGSFASQGLLQPLDHLVLRDNYDTSLLFPATIDEAYYRGQLYAVPWNTDNRALYYNQDLFDEVGLDRNTPPATWEEVLEYARRIDRIDGQGALERVGFVPHWGNWYFPAWLWAAGGDLLDETNTQVIWNSEQGVHALEFMQERLRHYGGQAALNAFSSQFPTGTFFGGSLGMVMDGSWALGGWRANGIPFDFGVGNPPRPAGLEGTPTTWSGGFALVIPQGITGEQQEAAWAFIKFYTDTWAQTQLGSRTGQIPAQRIAATSEDFFGIDPLIYRFVDLMNHSRFRPVIPSGRELWDYYVNRVHQLLTEDQMPARQILDEMARQGQIALDEGWERAVR